MTKSSFRKPWGGLLAVGTFALTVIATPVLADDLVVSAAASLTNAFKEIGQNFEQQHLGHKVLNSFAASDVLLQQIVNGAPVDVFASADQKAMDKAIEADAVESDTRKDFVRNGVVLIVPANNPQSINSVADLDNAKVTRVAYGNPATVPVGRYTQGALEQSGNWAVVQSRKILGQNVRQVLDYVARGEVDAGFVFSTDAAIMKDKVTVVEVLETTVPVTYPIALVKRDGRNKLAQVYQDYILSDAGQSILQKYGFNQP